VTASEGNTEGNANPVQITDFSGEERDEGVVGNPCGFKSRLRHHLILKGISAFRRNPFIPEIGPSG